MSINADVEITFDDPVQILELNQLITDPDDHSWANCLVIIRQFPKYYALNGLHTQKEEDGAVSVSMKMKELKPIQLMKWHLHHLVMDQISEGHIHLEDLTNEELGELYTEGHICEEEYNEWASKPNKFKSCSSH